MEELVGVAACQGCGCPRRLTEAICPICTERRHSQMAEWLAGQGEVFVSQEVPAAFQEKFEAAMQSQYAPPDQARNPAQQGVKNSAGKPRLDLLPPLSLLQLAMVANVGAAKYAHTPGGARNWEKGICWGDIYRAAMGHLLQWWAGETHDPDGQHHLASAAWCCLVLLEYERTHPELDPRQTHHDRPTMTEALRLRRAEIPF